ncbi:Uncharacterised protein [Mycobacteroides abscessus subsp. abscessus]|nr:Uncharacterised protein [Mycobacteroides abscessus subsp. abscessus]
MNRAADGSRVPRSPIVGTNIELSSRTFHLDLNRRPPLSQIAALNNVQLTKTRGFNYE